MIRLQKYLSERGIASRRAAADLIKAGRVTVNDQPVLEPGAPVQPSSDNVKFDGNPVATDIPARRTIMFNKPRGYICSRSSKQGQTIYDILPIELHDLLPVGRLDKNSEGLLLMSNDGDLMNQLTHPKHEHAKTYLVYVSGTIDTKALKKLNSRMIIDGYRIQAAVVTIERQEPDHEVHILRFVLKEGRKRQIRYMCEQAGLKVRQLVRVKINNLPLGDLNQRKWRDLTEDEARSLVE